MNPVNPVNPVDPVDPVNPVNRMKATAEHYTFTVEHRGPDGAMTVKRALKHLLRQFGLKCISISQEKNP